MKENVTVITLLLPADNTQDMQLINNTAIKMLGSIKTSTFNDNYSVMFYNGILSEEEKRAFSTKLQDLYSVYSLFLACNKETVDKIKDNNTEYINAILTE